MPRLLPLLGLLSPLFLTACQGKAPREPARTPAERARLQLLDELIDKTMRREAFSPIKNAILGLEIEKSMRAMREDFAAAEDEHALLQALARLSNLRRDRHLRVRPVRGGLRPRTDSGRGRLPLVFAVHYEGREARGLFVADVPIFDAEFDALAPKPAIGDLVVGVHGMSFEDWHRRVTPYIASSTRAGHWDVLAKSLPRRPALWPDELKPKAASLRLRRADGSTYDVELPWSDPETLQWEGVSEPYYEGFHEEWRCPSFDVHRYAGSSKVLLLRWHGFGATLLRDVERLMRFAQDRDCLSHDLILDMTRCRGGSRGAYAVQRLFGKRFKTTFGNLRVSDVTPLFVEQQKRRFARLRPRQALEDLDNGRWLMQWLLEDVQDAIARGAEYTDNVPFKLAHAPKHADGVLEPAKTHFLGRAVVLLGPHGGSHLDQFASIVVDNELAHTIGMPTGGYSNTWEWTETLVMPGSERPLCSYMWSIGHTIRPNGEVLEGNPAKVAEHYPTTRDNYRRYHSDLIDRAMTKLGLRSARPSSSSPLKKS